MSQRILIIDDEEGVRDAFEMALFDTDYVVETAETGEQGLEKARASRPDLVFLDLRMPGINGVQTLRGLRELYPDLNVHIMTAFYQQYLSELRQANEEGITFELSRKPMDGSQIRMIVNSQLGGDVLSMEAQ
ncbi:MAG: response regulator [Gammaproteobacteria bacterium]|nr:response regulator [Gammaproteobacteria bacterium]MCP5135657.1 response regulator [Gammaproteobacteria bacterium]